MVIAVVWQKKRLTHARTTDIHDISLERRHFHCVFRYTDPRELGGILYIFYITEQAPFSRTALPMATVRSIVEYTFIVPSVNQSQTQQLF